MHEGLYHLATLVKQRNEVDNDLSDLIGRPSTVGNIGEYIASKVFDIELQERANHKGHDGIFASGPLEGKTVNVKFYTKQQYMVDINLRSVPDSFLVLVGPTAPLVSSRGTTLAIFVQAVYLFDAQQLIHSVQSRGTKVGTATSVVKQVWQANEIYPSQASTTITLTDEQKTYLQLFSMASVAQ